MGDLSDWDCRDDHNFRDGRLVSVAWVRAMSVSRRKFLLSAGAAAAVVALPEPVLALAVEPAEAVVEYFYGADYGAYAGIDRSAFYLTNIKKPEGY